MQFDTGQNLAYVYMTTKGSLAVNNFTFPIFFLDRFLRYLSSTFPLHDWVSYFSEKKPKQIHTFLHIFQTTDY